MFFYRQKRKNHRSFNESFCELSVIEVLTALGAQSFEHIVDAVNLEISGQRYHRCGNAAQAEGALATLAIEMGMHVVEVRALLTTVATSMTHSILQRAGAVVDGMDEVVGKKQGDAAVDGGLVHSVEPVLQALQREGVVAGGHRLEDEDAHGRGLDATLLKQIYDMLLPVHCHHPCQPCDLLALSLSTGKSRLVPS